MNRQVTSEFHRESCRPNRTQIFRKEFRKSGRFNGKGEIRGYYCYYTLVPKLYVGRSEFRFLAGDSRFFCSEKSLEKSWDPSVPLLNVYRVSFPGTKWRERDAENVLLLQFSAEGTNELSCATTPRMCFLVVHKNKFAFISCFRTCFLIPVETYFTICFQNFCHFVTGFALVFKLMFD